jgi:MFS superfamily sulfate permease-like transporter
MQAKISGDILPSIIVFLVALPLCMGIAIASGMPPAAGLITGIIGGIVVGSIAGSPLQVSGPAAGLAVIVAEIVREQGVQALGPMLVLAGIIQLAAGFLKVGQWFRAISPAVIFGMLSGIGVLIFAGQFHVMLDDKPKSNGILNLITIPNALYMDFFNPEGYAQHHVPALLGLLTIGTILLWNRFRPKALKMIPGALIGVILATIAALLVKAQVNYVEVPPNLLAAANWVSLQSLGRLADKAILFGSLTLAFVASAETLLSAGAVDRMHDGPRTDYDKELRAQGIGNTLCGLAGALPMTGVIVRSSANVQAGAKTRWSAVMHGVWMLVFVAAVPFVLERVPVASLAGILVYTGYKLVDWKSAKGLLKYGKMPLVIYLVTVIGVVAIDLLTGVIMGIVLSFIRLVHTASQIDIWTEERASGNRYDVHVSGAATFVKLPVIAQAFEKIPRSAEVHVHFAELVTIDHSVMDLLTTLEEEFERNGGQFVTQWEQLHARHEKLTSNGQPRVERDDREVAA